MLDQSPEQLLIDLSPAPPPDEAEVRAWASGRSVFVSSVIIGHDGRAGSMRPGHRGGRRCARYVRAFWGNGRRPREGIPGQVASSDIYLGILGQRYGTPLRSGYSATHAEYDEAMTRGLRSSIWNSNDELDGRQRDFLEEVRVFHTTGTYDSPDDLARRVEGRLRVIAVESICTLGQGGKCNPACHIRSR